MDKTQAYNIIVNVTAQLQLNRADHQTIVQALEVLKPTEETKE